MMQFSPGKEKLAELMMNYWLKMKGWIFTLTSFLASRVGEGDFSGSAESSCIDG
jgi:hypothetical protein